MSYAAFKMMHWATGIEHCASGYVTHSPSDFAPHIPPASADDLEADLPAARRVGPIPNLVVTAGNVLEVYLLRVQEDDGSPPRSPADLRRGGVVEGIAGARLELVCHYRLHGNVESMAILSAGSDNRSKKRDSIILAFQDAKISVMEYNDSIHGLRTSISVQWISKLWIVQEYGAEWKCSQRKPVCPIPAKPQDLHSFGNGQWQLLNFTCLPKEKIARKSEVH